MSMCIWERQRSRLGHQLGHQLSHQLGQWLSHPLGNLPFTLLCTLLILAYCAGAVSATQQIPDILIYGDEVGELDTSYLFPSPLELYYSHVYPFPPLSTAIYRGHIAVWEIKEGKLYLTGVLVDEIGIPLDWLFDVEPNAAQVSAVWFSGILLGRFGQYKEWHRNPYYPGNFYVERYAAYVVFEVQNGNVIDEVVLTEEEYWQAVDLRTKDSLHVPAEKEAAVLKYRNYIESFAQAEEKPWPADRQESQTSSPQLQPQLQPQPQLPPPSDTPIGQLLAIPATNKIDESDVIGWQMCRNLAGFEAMKQDFAFDEARVGNVSLFPKSLYIEMFASNKGIINSIRWWNPLHNDLPQYNWHDFLKLYEEASAVIAQHTWLYEWREATPGRRVELRAFGLEIGETDSKLETIIMPVWQQAGFRGQPAYSVLARFGNHDYVEIYFGKDDPRALVTSNSSTVSFYYDDNSPQAQEPKSISHWLDSLDVYFHPRCTSGEKSERYAVIEPSGKFEVRQFVGCRR
ncbi:MAG TPA: hypothetical protein GXX29_06525 [Firmicutes bacterium]|nr:hypothetical protein [Bacillota bacterium]